MSWRDIFRPSDMKATMASPFFDGPWYLDRYEDVRASGMHPAKHYAAHGVADLRDPGPMLSTSGYQRLHDTYENPLIHMQKHGHSGEVVFDGAQNAADHTLLMVGHQAEASVFGAERSFLTMLEQAASQGATVHALLPGIRNADYMDAVLARVHKLHIVPYCFRNKKPPNRSSVKAMKSLIRSINPQAVHQNTLAVDAVLTAAQEMGLRTVMHVRELPAEDAELCAALQGTPAQLRAKAMVEADVLVANSQKVSDWLNAPDVAVAPNVVDETLFALDTLPHIPLRVGLIGNLINKKGIGDFMMVAQAVAEAGINAQFILIGPETKELRTLKPWPETVIHAGYAPSSQDALAAVDVVLSLSHFAESFGRTVLEAMAAGRPVVCYDRGTPPSLLGQGLANFVCAADSPKAVAQKLIALIEDRAFYLKTSKQMRKRARVLQDQSNAVDLSQIYGSLRE